MTLSEILENAMFLRIQLVLQTSQSLSKVLILK